MDRVNTNKKFKVTYRLVSSFLIGLLLVCNLFLIISTFIINRRQPLLGYLNLDKLAVCESKKMIEELRKSYKDELKEMARYYNEYKLIEQKTKGKKKTPAQLQKMKNLKKRLKSMDSLRKQELMPKAARIMNMFLKERQLLADRLFKVYDFVVMQKEGRNYVVNYSNRSDVTDRFMKDLDLKLPDAKEGMDFVAELWLVQMKELDI